MAVREPVGWSRSGDCWRRLDGTLYAPRLDEHLAAVMPAYPGSQPAVLKARQPNSAYRRTAYSASGRAARNLSGPSGHRKEVAWSRARLPDRPYLRRQNSAGRHLLHSRFRVRIIAAVLCPPRTASTSEVMRRKSKERKESVGGRSRDFRSWAAASITPEFFTEPQRPDPDSDKSRAGSAKHPGAHTFICSRAC